jgi:Cys-rich repeat protein
MSPTPDCLTSDGICVECLADAECAGNHVCDAATHACRACTDNSECESGFCLVEAGECRSGVLTPKYLPTICDTTATSPLTLAADMSVNTTDDAQCTGGVVAQTGTIDICVVHYQTVTIPTGFNLVSSGDRALAIVSDSDVRISGSVDASSGAGPQFSSGGMPSSSVGGGGAGFKTAGGAGGSLAATGGASNGGAPVDAVGSQVFLGGPSSSGRGGGALMIISCNGTVNIEGTISANGRGGAGGNYSPASNSTFGGAGGSAGGDVLLQGQQIQVTGQLFANGGGGGEGFRGASSLPTQFNGTNGSDGTASLTCASGGPAASAGGAGGDGGCVSSPPGSGGKVSGTAMTYQQTPGGGGGSVGFLRIATPAGISPLLTPSAISPAFEANETIARH